MTLFNPCQSCLHGPRPDYADKEMAIALKAGSLFYQRNQLARGLVELGRQAEARKVCIFTDGEKCNKKCLPCIMTFAKKAGLIVCK